MTKRPVCGLWNVQHNIRCVEPKGHRGFHWGKPNPTGALISRVGFCCKKAECNHYSKGA